VAIVENIQREDLSPLELATALLKLREQFNLTHGEISRRVGKAESTVKNIQRLLKLPDSAKRALASGRITEQHARAILSLDGDSRKQQELLDYILKYNWTAPKAEQFVVAIKKGGVTDIKVAAKHTETSTKETKAIAKKLNAKVSLRRMAKGGRLIIDYKDDKDLKRITQKLSQ
jgi:ParB family chromosome partitioning protein